MAPISSAFCFSVSMLAAFTSARPTKTAPWDNVKRLRPRDLNDDVFAAAGMNWSRSHTWGQAAGQQGSKAQSGNQQSQCSLSKVTMPNCPSTTSTPYPSPSGTLKHIAIGRGTQNYTCASSSPSATPAAVGALASLYDASCVASSVPELLAYLPLLALGAPDPNPYSQSHQSGASNGNTAQASASAPTMAGMPLIGHHYFTDPKSPVFNLDTDAGGNLGYVDAEKKGDVPAPEGAPEGLNGLGSVDWLYLVPGAQQGGKKVRRRGDAAGDRLGERGELLEERDVADARAGSEDIAERDAKQQPSFSQVYRVVTAGGVNPKSCQGMPASFEVEYAAQYWFYQ